MTGTTGTVPRMSWLRTVRRILYWTLPPLLLWLILRRIDVTRLKALAGGIDGALFGAGLATSALIVTLGAWRWHVLTGSHPGLARRWRGDWADYWRSLAIGVLTPGAIGSDAYRATALAGRTGRWGGAVMLLLAEKLAALLACGLLLGTLALVVQLPAGLSLDRFAAPQALVLALALMLVLMLMLVLVACVSWLLSSAADGRRRRLARACRQRWVRGARSVAKRLGGRTPAARERARASGAARIGVARAVGVVGLSVGIFAVSALQSHLFFRAIGHDVSYAINLTVAPLLFMVFALPLSFGTIGVREGAFVLFYGVFGVAAEASLLVSFCGLVALLGGHAVGALLLWVGRRGESEPAVVREA